MRIQQGNTNKGVISVWCRRRQWHPTPVLLPGKSYFDGGAWWVSIYGVAQSRTWLSDFTFTFHFYALEKEMATHSSVLAWRIPGMGEPGGFPSMGSHRVGRDWIDLAAAAVSGVHSVLQSFSHFVTVATENLTHVEKRCLYPLGHHEN